MENIILYLFDYIKQEDKKRYLLQYYPFSSKKLLERVPLNFLLNHYKLDDSGFEFFFEEDYYKDKYYQYLLIHTQKIPNEYLEIYSEDLNWSWISFYQCLNEEQIERYSDKVNWFFISSCQRMSKTFILAHQEKIDWYSIIKNPYLNLEFINSFSSYIDWDSVSRYVILNIYFLKKHYDRINWEIISKERILDEEFIFECIDLIDFKSLALNNHIHYYSEKLIEKASPHLDEYSIYNIKARIIQERLK